MSTLCVLFRAIFPRREYSTSKQEREAIAAESRKWRALISVGLLALPVLVVAAIHFLDNSEWMPLVLQRRLA